MLKGAVCFGILVPRDDYDPEDGRLVERRPEPAGGVHTLCACRLLPGYTGRPSREPHF